MTSEETSAAYEAWRAAEFPAASNTKPTNPKDAIGSAKVPFDLVPDQVLGEVSLALLEGAAKYGAGNWRAAGVRASIYISAARRHLGAFREGQDIDPASGLSHITKAIAGLVVLRDSMLQGNWQDDRPIRAINPDWVDEQNKLGAAILARYPDPKRPFTQAAVEPLDHVPAHQHGVGCGCPPPRPCASCGGFTPRGCQDC